jgi:hypothetical protein
MTIIWGYTRSEKLSTDEIIGERVKEIKQMFSALIFKNGLKGFSVNFEAIHHLPVIKFSLIIDSIAVDVITFSPERSGEFTFILDEIVYPKSKIEVSMEVLKGSVEISTSSIGTGMGFQKIDDAFVPTYHFALGLIVP